MLGAGVLGLLTSLLLQRSGWRPLLAEPLAWRRAVAGSLGATAAAPEELAEERVPLVIDASGNPDAPAMALTMLAHEGTLLIASWFGTKPVVLPSAPSPQQRFTSPPLPPGTAAPRLVQAEAVDFDFPTKVDAILSTYALSQVPECAEVIARGAAALSGGGRWTVLDLKVPGYTPGWLGQLGTAIVRPFASIDEWIMHRPWDAIRAAMQKELADFSWTELFFGTAFLAAGARGPATPDVPPRGSFSG